MHYGFWGLGTTTVIEEGRSFAELGSRSRIT